MTADSDTCVAADQLCSAVRRGPPDAVERLTEVQPQRVGRSLLRIENDERSPRWDSGPDCCDDEFPDRRGRAGRTAGPLVRKASFEIALASRPDKSVNLTHSHWLCKVLAGCLTPVAEREQVVLSGRYFVARSRQMPSDDSLIAELIRRRDSGELRSDMSNAKRLPKPLAVEKIATAEAILALSLPGVLSRIYTTVANGGFGDSYGFLGLMGGPKNEAGLDAIGLWKAFMKPDPSDPRWRWRSYLLPIGHLGCGMYHCVDCRTKNGKIIFFEPNPHEDGDSWSDAFFPFCPSLNKYFSVWLDGGDLWEAFT